MFHLIIAILLDHCVFLTSLYTHFHPQLWRPAPPSALVGSVWLERMEIALVSVVLDSSLMDQHVHVSCTVQFVSCVCMFAEFAHSHFKLVPLFIRA